MLEFEHTERLLELHATYMVPACFAVVGAAALPGARPYHDPAQIRRIHAAGHEIASHSFQHEWLPGLDRAALRRTLQESKSALEQCIGAQVVTFVPPYNQPFDYLAGWSFSLSERRAVAGRERTDLRRLCDMLVETGYRFCRVAYRSMPVRLVEQLLGRPLDRSARVERIGDLTCMRLNTAGGFDRSTLQILDRCVANGGTILVYGHPHSITSGNAQDEKWLVPFLERVRWWHRQRRLQICQPRDLIQERPALSYAQQP
jgi:peptidoglycan/xylan/chitin deacetylase (PgdA/CDA1 family)